MTLPIHMSNDTVRMSVFPGAGAVIRNCDIWIGTEWQPLLAPARGAVASDPTMSSFFPMLPWCNRLSASAVATNSGLLPVPRTWPACAVPVHGTGWLRPWEVSKHSLTLLNLRLSDNFGPYSFEAKLQISLRDLGFQICVEVTNMGLMSLQFGIGFHPYFVRTSASSLELNGDAITLTGKNGLPKRCFQRQRFEEFDVTVGRRLRGLSAFFHGAKQAVVSHRLTRTSIRLGSDTSCGFLVWAPAGEEFFCIEPMTHHIDAFSRRQTASPNEIHPGETIELSLSIDALVDF